ncbi:hypothetical protein K523DRAFT_204615, partial [Schizophyllum commune Tattone D]
MSRMSSKRSERSLPPVPTMESPAPFSAPPAPSRIHQAPSSIPPALSSIPSAPCSPTPKRPIGVTLHDPPCKSPSIANLSQRSVVKNRLAQIQSPTPTSHDSRPTSSDFRWPSNGLRSPPQQHTRPLPSSRIAACDSPSPSVRCDQVPPRMSSAPSRTQSQYSVLDCYASSGDSKPEDSDYGNPMRSTYDKSRSTGHDMPLKSNYAKPPGPEKMQPVV